MNCTNNGHLCVDDPKETDALTVDLNSLKMKSLGKDKQIFKKADYIVYNSNERNLVTSTIASLGLLRITENSFRLVITLIQQYRFHMQFNKKWLKATLTPNNIKKIFEF